MVHAINVVIPHILNKDNVSHALSPVQHAIMLPKTTATTNIFVRHANLNNTLSSRTNAYSV